MISAKKQAIETTITYQEYVDELIKLVAQNKTSGAHQSEKLAYYTKLNLKRMQRLDKTLKLQSELLEIANSLPFKTKWIVISEAWCGDAAQNLPYIAALAQAANIPLGIVYRDENPDFMDLYLTNGTRSIPKLIVFDAATERELTTWGPRPANVQEIVNNYKKNDGQTVSFDTFTESVHLWYTKNNGAELSKELINLLGALP